MPSLKDDVYRFFDVFRSRNTNLIAKLPTPLREELLDELALLRRSILNRISEDE